MRLEPRTPGIRVKHLTTEPRGTLFADEKIKMTQSLKFVFRWVEITVGNSENAAYQNFLVFPQCFQKSSFLGGH